MGRFFHPAETQEQDHFYAQWLRQKMGGHKQKEPHLSRCGLSPVP